MPCQQPELDATRCTGCGDCAAACPCGAIEMRDGTPMFHCDARCLHSHNCVALVRCYWPCEDACPHDAIRCGFTIEVENKT